MNLTSSDWIAFYGAALSTAIVLVNAIQWLTAGPRLGVTVFNPLDTDYGGGKTFLAIISNTGKSSAVIQTIDISFRSSRWIWGKQIGSATFNEKSRWKPSVKLVPIVDKPNNMRPEPNVILPNEELRAPAVAISEYDASNHWIRVTAIPRNSSRKFVGWAGPVKAAVEQGVLR